MNNCQSTFIIIESYNMKKKGQTKYGNQGVAVLDPLFTGPNSIHLKSSKEFANLILGKSPN